MACNAPSTESDKSAFFTHFPLFQLLTLAQPDGGSTALLYGSQLSPPAAVSLLPYANPHMLMGAMAMDLGKFRFSIFPTAPPPSPASSAPASSDPPSSAPVTSDPPSAAEPTSVAPVGSGWATCLHSSLPDCAAGDVTTTSALFEQVGRALEDCAASASAADRGLLLRFTTGKVALCTRSRRRVTGNEFLVEQSPAPVDRFARWFNRQDVRDTEFEPRFYGTSWPSLSTPTHAPSQVVFTLERRYEVVSTADAQTISEPWTIRAVFNRASDLKSLVADFKQQHVVDFVSGSRCGS